MTSIKSILPWEYRVSSIIPIIPTKKESKSYEALRKSKKDDLQYTAICKVPENLFIGDKTIEAHAELIRENSSDVLFLVAFEFYLKAVNSQKESLNNYLYTSLFFLGATNRSLKEKNDTNNNQKNVSIFSLKNSLVMLRDEIYKELQISQNGIPSGEEVIGVLKKSWTSIVVDLLCESN